MSSPGALHWYHRPVVVLLMLFVVLGPLGLPYLWRSPAFSRQMKVLLTVLVAVYTALLVDETVRIFRIARAELEAMPF